MNLKRYFTEYGVEVDEFAVKSNLGIATVYRYMRGRVPTIRNACIIEMYTDGKVSVDDFVKVEKEKLMQEINKK